MKNNQASEPPKRVLGVPKLSENSEILPIEYILEHPEESIKLVNAASRCRCFIVDNPFVAVVEIKELRLEMTIGVGSIVCEEGCGIGVWRLALPAWVSGVQISGKCAYYGPSRLVDMLNGLVSLQEYDSSGRVVEAARTGESGGLIVAVDVDAIEFEQSTGFCGSLEATYPLHPAAVVGKPYYQACVKEYGEPVGKLSRIVYPLLRLSKKPIIWWSSGMLRDLMIIGFDPTTATSHAKLAAFLGILYTCGERVEQF
ncbi:MAG TPA: hypothetical protein EYH59_06020 [Pyrodictium sp.]|nr:hypothetical protein [Pyrodictium sp.]